MNADTVNAAGERIIGNSKVPFIVVNGAESQALAIVKDFETFVSDVDTGLKVVDQEISQFAQQSFISKEDWNRINREFRTIEINFNARIADIENAAEEAIVDIVETSQIVQIFEEASMLPDQIKEELDTIKQALADLANKIRR